MSGFTLATLTSGYNLSQINSNFTILSDALNNVVFYLMDGNNTMQQDLDMNSFDILNVNTMNIQSLSINGVAVVPSDLGSFAPNSVGTIQIIDGAVTDSKIVSVNSSKVSFQQLGTGATIKDIQSKAREIVSVKDYGAVGDGTTNDTVAIQAADSAASALGATLFFPSGTYLVGPTSISKGTACWQGTGKFSSVIKSASTTYSNLTGLVTVNSKNNIIIEDMGFDLSLGIFPPGSGNPGNLYFAIQLLGCSFWEIRNCSFTGIQPQTIGVAVDGGSNWKINYNYFNMPTPSGSFNESINISVNVSGVGKHEVKGNTLIGSGLFSNGSSGNIEGNYVVGWKFGGGLTFGPLNGCIANTIKNNYCASSAGVDINNTYPDGIECWSAYSLIEGNTCVSNSGSGISIGNIRCVVSNNMCFNNGQTAGSGGDGIRVNSADIFSGGNCVFTNNSCFDTQGVPTQGYGYREVNSGGPTITDNHVADNNFNNNKTGTMSTSSTNFSFRGPILTFKTAMSPGTITNGSQFSATYSFSSAAFGDKVTASFGADLQGCTISGFVSAANQIKVVITNNTGSSVSLPSSTSLNLWVEKPPGYASL